MHKLLINSFLLFFLSSCAGTYNLSKPQYVKHLIETEYVEEINTTGMKNESIHTMMQKLDSHSHYFSSQDLAKFLVSTRGQMGGVGIALHMQNHLLTVIEAIRNTPAQRAGIQSGDVILRINHTPTLGLNLEKCIALTRGNVGTNLTLTVLRKKVSKPLYFSIKRKYIHTNPIYATLIEHAFLYIHIPSFNAQIHQELDNIFKKYPHKKGIILDLRYNPGGRLDEAISLVDRFIKEGVIVSQKGRIDKYTEMYHASTKNTDSHTPMVILINKGSASASEIVAGVLQYYKRATIIGEKSFGKGTVQTLFPLGDESAIKLTIAKYYLPSGKCIDKIGIKPQFTIHNKMYITHKEKSITYKKAQKILHQLQNHSLIPKVMKQKHSYILSSKNMRLSPHKIKKDKQLSKAIEILKNNN